ncbi:MAG: hypothetical protein H0V56_07425 [Chthoniobacterales bacterium]|nr:hypothetical protein [Chthoniobacterales bacterium]
MIKRLAQQLTKPAAAIILLAFTTASAQQLDRRASTEEPLEKYGDPPAPMLLWRTGTSPAAVSEFNGFTSRQVNVNAAGQNIVGDAANEPSITVDSTNPNRMAVGWRQFNSVTSNFRQAGYGYTTDGGSSWTFPGNLENNVFRSDPVLRADANGSMFYLSLLQSFFDDMWRSSNGGISWARLNSATGGDKQWFTIDTTQSSGRGFQYQSWSTSGNNYGGRQFSRSTNGGTTWMDPIFIPNRPSWGTLDVDRDGNLFIAGRNMSTGQIWCVRSTDAKNGAVTPTFDQSTAVNLGGTILISQPINPVGLVGQVNIAADRSGTVTDNNISMLASVRPTGATNGSDVMFVRSTDRGLSFSAPRRINDDPIDQAKWHWFGAMGVAPNGRIDAIWLDTRNAANNTDSQLFYAYSFDGGENWSPNIAASASFNPLIGYPNQNKMGDYMDLQSDDTGTEVAYCATLNGEQDIFHVRLAPRLPVALSAVSRKVHGAAGTFDLPLALSGRPTIENRRGTGATGDAHQVIVTFAAPVSLTGVTVTSSNGAATATQAVNGTTVVIDLANVTDAQLLAIKLSNVNDGANFGDITIPLAVLQGDSNGNGSVNASDVSQTKSQSGQPLTTANFQLDVNTSGDINASDVGIVKSRTGASLP